MSNRESSNPITVMGVAVVAALAGAATALLLTPKTGKEVRGEIKARADKARIDAQIKANQVKQQASSKAEELKGKASDVSANAKDTVKQAADHVKQAADEADAQTQRNIKR